MQPAPGGAVTSNAGATAFTRPRVDALLAQAWKRRLTLLTAGGGHGKTTALRALAASGDCRWVGLRPVDREIELLAARLAEVLELGAVSGLVTPGAAIGAEDRRGLAEALAAAMCQELAERDGELLLVIDDLERLGADSAAAYLLRALALQAPASLHLVFSGQRLPDLGLGAARSRDELLEITAPDLAFTSAEVAVFLTARLGEEDPALVARCHALTGGWAAALAVVTDQLSRVEAQRRHAVLDRLPLLEGQLWREFVLDLLERESHGSRRALFLAAVAPCVDPELLAAIGVEDPRSTLAGLTSRGLLVVASEGEYGTVSPVLMAVMRELVPLAEATDLRERAAGWLESAGRLGEALECRVGGPASETRALLERHGQALVARGYGVVVAEAVRSVGIDDSPALRAVLGEALQSVGDWDGAMDAFALLRGQAATQRLQADVAWRLGALLYFRGDSAEAIEVLSAAGADGDQGTADDALVSAWLSSALWNRGEADRAAAVAESALRQAEESQDPAALAAAHVACALAAASAGERERNERHYRAALQAAGRAGDSIQLARIRANLSSRAVEEGDLHRAIEEADNCLRVGAGHRFFAAIAMCNKADALLQLGELDDARAHLAESIEIFEALGSLLASAPHTMLGALSLERGDLTRARISFERAQRLAEAADDAHTLVRAGCGLARTLAPDDPDAARSHVAEALGRASSLERAHALCTSARVELVAGDPAAALRLAGEAEREARATGDRPTLAEALAVQALSQRPLPEEPMRAAAELWAEVGNPIAHRRALLVLAERHGERQQAEVIREQLAQLGVTAEFEPAIQPSAELAITTLGRFAIHRGGEPVPAEAWQSRKARDLVKLLVARLGKPITREAAAEALWPGEAPGPLSNRLSVALSTVRRVLDPERRHPPDHYILADNQSLALQVDHLHVDVIEFLGVAGEAIAGAAEARLRTADRLYAGDFLEEDMYEDWAVDCREQARAAALEVSRLLARAASDRDDHEAASRHLRRVLEHDGYDEDAWIGLVGAQFRMRRHGEARRQHAIYARRMAELGITPMAFADATSGIG